MEEIWKPCPFAEGSHMVSNLGRFKKLAFTSLVTPARGKSLTPYFRKSSEKIVASQLNMSGYLVVKVSNDEFYEKIFTVHRLVATAFIPNPEGKREINHIDGNKQNNAVENLEWVTRQENMIHSTRVLKKGSYINNENRKGSSEGYRLAGIRIRKLTDSEIVSIFYSNEKATDLASKHGVTYKTIHEIKRGLKRYGPIVHKK